MGFGQDLPPGRLLLAEDPAYFVNHRGLLEAEMRRPDQQLRPGASEPSARGWHQAVGRPAVRRVAEGRNDRVKRNTSGRARLFQLREERMPPGELIDA
jgi:hypothetical protein